MSELPIPVKRVKEAENRKIMLGCEEIAVGTFGGDDKPFRVVQSANRNVITIISDGYYNHVIVNDIILEVLKLGLSVKLSETPQKQVRQFLARQSEKEK